jgi:lipoate-protein ligase A
VSRAAYWLSEASPGSPEHNMAVDAALLAEQVQQAECYPIVRLYEWDRPAVSIGRLQLEEPVRRQYPDLLCVRRPTGGRAVLHGNDLTITVAIQAKWLPSQDNQTVLSSYRTILEGVLWALQAAGHSIDFGTQKAHSERENIHCFEVAAGCDLVDRESGQKIAGCAQRRVGQAILQQMSFPLGYLSCRQAFVEALPQGLGHALTIDEWRFPNGDLLTHLV